MPRYMYDSDDATAIPKDAKYAAGYVDGSRTYPVLVKLRPKAQHLSISIHGARAKCYDMESGALTIKSGVACAKHDIDAGEAWPWLYFSVSNLPAVEAECRRQGIWGRVILWGAHYGVPDSALTAPFHALQNVAVGYGATGHWDRSVLADHIPGFDPEPQPLKPHGFAPPLRAAIHLVVRRARSRKSPLTPHARSLAEQAIAGLQRMVKL